LKSHDLRFNIDISNSSVQSKIKLYSEQKVPFIIVIGGKENENKSVTYRTIGSEKQMNCSLESFIQKMNSKIASKALDYNLGE
jgi:threonyl-tRNA synthetase